MRNFKKSVFRKYDNQVIVTCWLIAGVLSLTPGLGFGAAAKEEPPATDEVIETDIGFEPPVGDQPPKFSIKPRAKFNQTEVASPLAKVELTERDIVQLNRSLRQMIEENEKLSKENKDLDRELKGLRGQWTLEQNRKDSTAMERDAYKQQNEKIIQLNKIYEKDMADLKTQLEAKDKQVAQILPDAVSGPETGVAVAVQPENKIAKNTKAILSSQTKGLDVIDMLDRLKSDNEQLKTNESRIHYNMGNLFFNQGEYRKAAHEYRQALRMTPQDSNAHFNLAFVSGEFLNDPKTALQHYRHYLRLNPKAEDSSLVQEKILDAQIRLKTQLNSIIEEDLKKEKRDMNVQ